LASRLVLLRCGVWRAIFSLLDSCDPTTANLNLIVKMAEAMSKFRNC
jgi:hypothetical protein